MHHDVCLPVLVSLDLSVFNNRLMYVLISSDPCCSTPKRPIFEERPQELRSILAALGHGNMT